MIGFALLYDLGSKSDDSSRNTCVEYGICGWIVPCEIPRGFSGAKSGVPCDER